MCSDPFDDSLMIGVFWQFQVYENLMTMFWQCQVMTIRLMCSKACDSKNKTKQKAKKKTTNQQKNKDRVK